MKAFSKNSKVEQQSGHPSNPKKPKKDMTLSHGTGCVMVPKAVSNRMRPGQRGKVSLIIPAAQPDIAGLLSAGREWLVPLLVREFLRDRGIEPISPYKASKNRKMSYGMHWQGARETSRGVN